MEKALDDRDDLMGDTFTVADCYLFTVLNWSPWVKIDQSRWPSANEYLRRVAARPAVQASLKAEGLLKSCCRNPMDCCPEVSHSIYHGGAMTLLKTALLACLALPAFAAHAQTQAPAEDRPGRYVLVPMSVERPVGEGWILIARNPVSIQFSRDIESEGTSRTQQARAFAQIPDKRISSIEDLVERLRRDLRSNVNQERFRVLSEIIEIDSKSQFKCVNYFHRAEDKQSPQKDKPQTIDLRGRSCLHPNDEKLVVGISFTEIGPANSTNDAANQSAQFTGGVHFHIPLAGSSWRPHAEQGDANAQVWLARSLLQTNELEEAIVWLVRAAEKGHLDARALLGLSYLTGRAVTRNPEEALKWLRPAAEKGYPKAEGLLGMALITAAEVRNNEEGLLWIRKAAAGGDPLGQALLGKYLLFGENGLKKNESEGATWLRRAAEQGDAGAQYILANLLYNGIGGVKDRIQSRFWLERSAAQGHVEARNILDRARPSPMPAPVTAPAQAPAKAESK